MKRARFSEEQIIGILKAAEAVGNIRQACRENNITEQTLDIRMLKETKSGHTVRSIRQPPSLSRRGLSGSRKKQLNGQAKTLTLRLDSFRWACHMPRSARSPVSFSERSKEGSRLAVNRVPCSSYTASFRSAPIPPAHDRPRSPSPSRMPVWGSGIGIGTTLMVALPNSTFIGEFKFAGP